MLAQTVGIPGRLGAALSGLAGMEEAFVFGSWAARYLGEPGPAPKDIDVLVVGEAPLRSVRQACSDVERERLLKSCCFISCRAGPTMRRVVGKYAQTCW